jgi:hypothetical protein
VRHNHDIFPYYLGHAKKVFPHLDCLDELKLISDLTNPPNWYPEVLQFANLSESMSVPHFLVF